MQEKNVVLMNLMVDDVKISVTKDEAERLVAAHKDGAVLYFETEGRRLTVAEDGTLYAEGFSSLPRLFCALDEYGWINKMEKVSGRLRALVKKAVVSEGTEGLWYSFCDFSALKEVVLPESLRYITEAFENCAVLKPYAMPSQISSLYGHIYGKKYPEHLVLPDTVKDMETAFKESSIRSLVIPGSVKEVPSHACAYAKELEEVVISEGVECIAHAVFTGCTSLRRVVLPKSLKTIEDYAFSSCKALEDIELPEGVDIDEKSFIYSPLQEKMGLLRLLSLPKEDAALSATEKEALKVPRAVLEEKSLEEQLSHLFVSESCTEEESSYGVVESERVRGRDKSLSEISNIKALLLWDGVIVGLRMKEERLLIGKTVCTYSAVDEDGTGSRSVTDYATLLCRS